MGFLNNFKKRGLLINFRDVVLENVKELKDGGLIKSWSYACVFSTLDLLDSLFFSNKLGQHNPFKSKVDILNKENINEIYKFFAIYSLTMFLHSNDTTFERLDLTKEKKEIFENEIASIFEFSKKNLSHYQSMKDSLNEGQIINILYDLVLKEGLKITDFENDLEILSFKVASFPILMTGCFIAMYNSYFTEFTRLR